MNSSNPFTFLLGIFKVSEIMFRTHASAGNCGHSIYTTASFNLSATFSTASAAAATLGLDALLSFAFCFWDVLSLGSSLVKGIKSGAPGRYFLKGSGTLSPFTSR